MENALPQQDIEALDNNQEYSFTIKNTGTLAASYKLTLDNTCTLDRNYTLNNKQVLPDKCVPDSYIKVGIKKENNEYIVLEKEENKLLKGDAQISGTTKSDDGIIFDGIDDYIDMGNNNFDFQNQLTVGVRFKTKSFHQNGRVMIDNYSNSDGSSKGFEFYVAQNGRIVLQFFNKEDNSRIQVYTNTQTKLDEWNIAIATYDGKTMKIYLNGNLEKEFSLNAEQINSINSNNSIYLGANPNNKDYLYDGIISDAFVINDILSEEEIKSNYSNNFNYETNEKTVFYQKYDINDEYVLDASNLNGGEEKTYKMKIWLDYDTPNDYNSHGILNILYSGKLSLEYEQGITNYSTGDIITLKDNSKWIYLNNDKDNINLLSINMVGENGQFVENGWDAYKMHYAQENNSLYETSEVKTFIDNKVAPSIKNNLAGSGISENIINKINITIPDAEIISDVGNISSWSYTSDGAFDINSPNKYFLSNRSLTYWTKTAKDDRYVWIVNMSNKLWYGTPSYVDNLFGVRPMITINKNILEQIKEDKENPELEAISSPKYLVYDVNKKQVIIEKNTSENEIWHPASLTKLTTAIVAIEEIEKQNISLDDTITITEEVMNMVPATASVAGFKAGDIVTYRDLLYGVIHKSGADACYVLAIALSGSTSNFIELMNEYAEENNMVDTHYTNFTGLIDPNYNHYSSLKDVAIGFAKAMTNTNFREIVKPIEYQTTNGLTFTIPEFGDLPYLIGLKNGHAVYYDIIKSGYNQANYYQKGSSEYIVVTSSNPDDSTQEHRTLDNYLLWHYLFD